LFISTYPVQRGTVWNNFSAIFRFFEANLEQFGTVVEQRKKPLTRSSPRQQTKHCAYIVVLNEQLKATNTAWGLNIVYDKYY
jgi:hypothetical protein